VPVIDIFSIDFENVHSVVGKLVEVEREDHDSRVMIGTEVYSGNWPEGLTLLRDGFQGDGTCRSSLADQSWLT